MRSFFNPNQLILGTRGSELALTQTTTVESLLRSALPALEVEKQIIQTSGDKRQDLRFAEFAKATGGVIDKGIFIKELEMALERRDVDAAVHSLKDVPSDLGRNFLIAAVLQRANVEDVLVSAQAFKSIKDLPVGARVGTSSVRRMRQLKWMRPDVEVVEIRGNVPTRVRKVTGEHALDAVLLAAAGLERLGLLTGSRKTIALDDLYLHALVLDCHEFLPAAGQGAIAIETLAADQVSRERVRLLNHSDTEYRVLAEREFLRVLGAGCQTPVGALTWVDGKRLNMRVRVFSETDPERPPQELEDDAPLSSPLTLARRLAAMVYR
jgi:hydroxymethylbilane synthase